MTIRSLKEIRNENCKDCGLCKTAEFICLPGYGSDQSKIMFIGEAPGHREDASGRPFVGKAGEVLDILFDELGIERKKVYLTNIIHCRPPENRTPNMDEIRACRKYLLKEINIIKPKIIVTLGNVALKGLFDTNTLSVVRERGRILDFKGIKIIPTYHPAVVLRKKYYMKLIYQDLKEGLQEAKQGQFPLQKGPQKEYIGIFSKLDRKHKVIGELREAKVVVVDVETTGLDMYDSKEELLYIGLTNKAGRGIVFKNTLENRDLITDILKGKELVIGHHIKFDFKWLYRFGIVIKSRLFDTMTALHLLDENYPDKSLKHLVRTNFPELGSRLDKAEKRILMHRAKEEESSPEEWLEYNGGDVDGTFRLYEKFGKALEEQGLMNLMKFEMRNLKVLAYMEINGFKIDRKAYDDLKLKYEVEIKLCEVSLKRFFGDINLNSTKQLGEKLYGDMGLPITFRSPGGAPSCNEAALQLLAKEKSHKEAIGKLLNYRSLEKLYSVYILGLTKNGLLKSDGKVHCNYKITGTVTGRLSCADPNLQNIPRDGDIKSMFCSSFKGGMLIQGDYSQAELRLLAHYSNSRSLIKAFESGRDIHTEVATRVFRKPYETITEKERKFTKQVNFGIIYLISDTGLAEKIGCSEREAGTLKINWFKEFPEALEWIKTMKKLVVDQGYTENVFGRRRRFFGTDPSTSEGRENQRQGVNAPIQGGAGDLTKWVGTEVHYKLKKLGLKGMVIGNVHDSVIIDSPREEVEEIAKILKKTAMNPPIKLKVPMIMEIKIGKNWKELKETKINVN